MHKLHIQRLKYFEHRWLNDKQLPQPVKTGGFSLAPLGWETHGFLEWLHEKWNARLLVGNVKHSVLQNEGDKILLVPV